GTGNGTAGTDPTGNVLTNDTDVDSGDTKTVQGVLDGNQGSTPVSGNVGTGGSFGPGISANAPNDYGSLVMKDTGEFAFTVNQNNATVQALRSGQSVDAIYTYTVRDTAGATSNALLTIHIMGANDAPTINKPASLSATEDTPLTITTVSVADVDAGSNPVKVTLDLSHGKINLASVAGLTFVDATANNSASLHFTGTLTNVNAAMNGMTYTPDLNFNDTQTPGGDSLAITVNDQDAGGALSASGSVPISVASVNDPPTAGTDTFDTIGNTELRVDLSAGTTPAVSKTTASGKGVLGNDSDPVEGNPIAVTGIVGCADNTAPFDCTVSGQHIVMNANGTFSYVPAPGATSGTFQYTVTDDPTTTGGSPASVNGTVNINIFDKVWYVKAGAAGGNGTSEKPFGDFTSLNGAAGAGDSDGPGDYIFVYAGAYTITGGLELEADQHLYGEGFGLSLNRALNGNSAPVTLVAAGTYPTVTSAVDTIKMTAALPAEIRGLSLSSSGGNAIDLTAAGAYSGATALLISGNTFTGSTLQTVDINSAATGNRTVTVENNMWSGTHTGNGIDIALTAGGSLFVDVSGNNVVANSTAINIARTGGGTLTIQDFAGNVVSGNTGGNGIVVNTATFDSNSASAGFQSVSGGATAVGASGNGVGGSGVTLSNVQGILDFTDLDIYADNGAGFTASGTGGGFTVSTASGNSNIVAIGGPAVDINAAAITLPLQKITSTNSASAGVSLVNTTGSFSADNTSAITNAATTGVNVNGGSSSVTYNGTITDDVGQLVNVANTTGGTKEFTGAITDGDDGDGGGVSLTNNGGATISFRGGLVISTGANPGFTATGGGTVEVCNENPCNPNATGGLVNKITTTTGTALNVANTTISANKLEFKSISANGAANGIVLNNTGASGSLVVTGNNTNTLGGDASGGTIQNSTGDAISLTSTLSPSFTNVTISFNAAVQVAGSGVHGTQVTNFTFKNSTVSNTGHNLDTTNSFIGESDLRFDTQVAGTENNLSGAVTITNNVLNNALTDGVRIYNFNGTISDLNISNNSLTSGTTTGTSGNSKGTGINVQILGSAATVSNLTKATIANNTIANFPGGAGIEVQGGNANTSGNGGTVGTPGNVTNVVSITGNNIHGQSNVNRMGTSAILVTVGGGRAASRSQGNFDISNNGTVANPLTNIAGTVIGVGANGYATVESLVNNNVIVANHAVAGTASNGVAIAGGVVTGTSDTPDLTAKVTNNNISQTDGNGILAVTRGVTGFLKVTIKSNTVTAPLSGNREGIRVDAGNLASVDDAVCADIQSNTSDGSGVATGIGLRKQGTAPTVNDFGIEGMAATSSPGVEAYVNGLNPAGGSTELISATSGFTNCASAPNAPVSSGASASSSFAPAQSKLGRAVTDEAHSSATRRDLIDADPTPTFGFSPDAPFFLFGNKAPAPVSAPAVSPTVNPAPVVNNAPAADAPARVWSDMPIIINRAPLSDSATDDKSADKDEDSAKEKDDAAKDSDATSDSQAAPKKARKPARTKKADDQPESSQPENRNISYLGPLGSAPSRAPQFVRASYEAGDAVRNSRAVGDAVVPRDRSVKAAPAAARAAAAPLVVPDVSVNVGTLPAGKSVTIRFKATVNSPFPDGVTQVSNQGSVTYAESGSPVLTDDPDVAGASDPTVTPVNAVSMHVNDASAPELASGNSTMLFTVALVAPAPGSGVSVNYATANGGANPATGGASCGGAVDYQTTSGTLTFASGEKVKTIPVTICADTSSPETDETLLLNISGASSGTITDAQAVGTITQGNTAGTILISELRTSGPNGPADEFVELYNNTETNQDISGYGLFKKGADCAASPVLIAAIPGAPGSNTTVMPARSHYLLVGSQYSLKDYGGTDAAKGDQTLTSDIEADANVGLFTVTDPNLVSTAAKVDGVGFGTNTGGACDLLREGTNLPPVSGSPTEHTFFRKQCDFVGGVGCSTPGNPKDTNDNSVDFTFADTEATPIAGVQQRLGAPGPENKTSPVRRDDKGLNLLVLDQSKSSSAVPNRVRNGAMGDPDTSTFGTLVIRRRVVNNTGADVTRLRFRIVEMTTAATSPGVADLRAITGDDEASVGPVGDTATCFASNGVATTPCSVSVSKTTLETPPAQSKGGGLNSTLTVLLGTPLQNGKSLNVNFKLGVQTTGTFRFLVITEALP
ncbi:MAG: VCBS domain-containing protein, partial [Acidobacteria bacterium]|nr:VCBS domain-containing protein [Acidobacteriota bacterium]